MHFSLFTDGSCYPNPGKGGWAAIIHDGRRCREISGAVPHGSINKMELLAVINGLSRLPPKSSVKVFTDSSYVERPFNEGQLDLWTQNGWKRIRTGEPVQNADQWQRLLEIIKARNLNVTVQKVTAHNGNRLNERADFLSRKAAKAG